MWKLIWRSFVLSGVFWAGYYLGQHPMSEVTQTIQSLSDRVAERTLRLDQVHEFSQREFFAAKARLLEGKAEYLDGQYEKATRELDKALLHLKKASGKDTGSLLKSLIGQVQGMKHSLASGDQISPKTIEEVQKKLDKMLADR